MFKKAPNFIALYTFSEAHYFTQTPLVLDTTCIAQYLFTTTAASKPGRLPFSVFPEEKLKLRGYSRRYRTADSAVFLDDKLRAEMKTHMAWNRAIIFCLYT